MQFKSLPQLLDFFKDEQTGIKYYEKIRWSGEPHCPHCGSAKPYKTNRGWKCRDKECHKKFTVRVGTIFENSKIPFRIWFAAIWLATEHKKGISSVQLSIDLGITQKTAWFVLHRIREMLRDKAPQMLGEDKMVETDATYIGGKESNKHLRKRRSNDDKNLTNEGKPYKAKKTIIGIIERNGKVALKYVDGETTQNMVDFVKTHVPADSTIYSDEAAAYKQLKRTYKHDNVKHSINIYVDGQVHTNTIENFWSVLKRGLYGVYHQVSDKHVSRYLDEYAARFNNRSKSSNERFHQFLEGSESVLSYKCLVDN
ncbi:IS1595 family transposase [uncultured Croceitalea sp.]|uniref:IS1595 family transposase n=1 Tax=uncultured Croceitalea sp. TaxID=1798908 RepID=UPI0033056382